MGRIGVIAALVVGACFSKPAQFMGDDSPPIDAPKGDGPPIDAPTTCTMLSTKCTGNEIERCATVGAAPIFESCVWGCDSSGTPRCKLFTPSGSALVGSDLAPDSALAATTLAAAFINGETGEIEGVRAAGTGLVSGIRFETRGAVGVFRFKSLEINSPLELHGVNAIALVAEGNITVNAIIDGTGTCDTGLRRTAGGGAGGAANVSAMTPGGGLRGTSGDQGGSGGGHGASGGNGGFNTGGGVLGGATFAFGTIRGGGGGGGGNGLGGAGGSGGAALQLASNGTVTITSAGAINAGGCGGRKTTANAPGAGGGAGGLIVIESHDVTVAGTLAVNGGGGSACEAAGNDGENGKLARTGALGGDNQSSTGDGGTGGFGIQMMPATLAGQNPPMSAARGGGGGGGVGRIVIKSAGGTVMGAGVMSPAFDDIGTTAVLSTIVVP